MRKPLHVVVLKLRRQRSLLKLNNSLRGNCETEVHVEACTEVRRGIAWWSGSFETEGGVRRKRGRGICPICSKEENCSRILRHDEMEGQHFIQKMYEECRYRSR
jgi:hypothetical protein